RRGVQARDQRRRRREAHHGEAGHRLHRGPRQGLIVRRRVVITGIGVVSPLGLDAPSTWAALLAGTSGIGPITKFDVSAFSCRIGGEVRGFEPDNYIDRKEVKKMDTFIHFAIAASKEAVADSGLTIDSQNDERVGVYIGSGIGGMPLFEETHKLYLDKGPRRISPF